MRWDYWSGPDEQDRRERYAEEFTSEYQANGDDVQRRIAAVEIAYLAAGGTPLPPGYASGWRPRAVNETTANAGRASTHITAQAGDRRDTPDGEFAWWCLRNRWVLEQHQLYQEHPVATVIRAWRTARTANRTPTPWCHLQSVPPGSHNRVYFPDLRAPAEWDAFLAAGGQEGAGYDAWTVLQAQGSVRTTGDGREPAPATRRGVRGAPAVRPALPDQGSGEET